MPRRITDIALSWGFRDATHFSRRFRQEFGVSAHEYRMSAQSLKGKYMFLDEASVTATENAITAAVLAQACPLAGHDE